MVFPLDTSHFIRAPGDPLAPYLFLLVIEILTCLVKQNLNIKGLIINDTEIKQCLFADDTTYFLQDSSSLRELKCTINLFSKMWKKVCENIQKTSIDSYSRHFQFIKVLHQYLGVNSNLFKWKILDSPRCSYCATDIETIKHLFCDCHVTRCLYYKIKEWCQSLNINLPEINEKSVLCGIQAMCEDSQIINIYVNPYQLVFKCKDTK